MVCINVATAGHWPSLWIGTRTEVGTVHVGLDKTKHLASYDVLVL
jgi:hypothetical protein